MRIFRFILGKSDFFHSKSSIFCGIICLSLIVSTAFAENHKAIHVDGHHHHSHRTRSNNVGVVLIGSFSTTAGYILDSESLFFIGVGVIFAGLIVDPMVRMVYAETINLEGHSEKEIWDAVATEADFITQAPELIKPDMLMASAAAHLSLSGGELAQMVIHVDEKVKALIRDGGPVDVSIVRANLFLPESQNAEQERALQNMIALAIAAYSS